MEIQEPPFVSESIGKMKWMDQLGHATLYVLEITAMSIKKMSAAKPENVLSSMYKKRTPSKMIPEGKI